LAALNQAASSNRRFSCIVTGLADKQGFTEVPADWKILDSTKPFLEEIPSGTLRPATPKSMQQVQAEVLRKLNEVPDYLFEQGVNKWEPVYNQNDISFLNPDFAISARESKKGAASNQVRWHLVTDLKPKSQKSTEKDQLFLDLAAPTSNSYTLVSVGTKTKQIENERELFDR
jgi:hypothetical protein